MKQTDQTLLEQMRITDFDIENRKALLSLTESDCSLLKACKGAIDMRLDALVDEFYRLQTSVPEIALLIGDADTLDRLRGAQHKYILDLFSGIYELEYVNHRLRIGLVHKRIGVEPKLYLAGINTLKGLLTHAIIEILPEETIRQATLSALGKLFLFDITLVFETYIRSLVSEIESSKQRSEHYAMALEEKVKERTRQLEEMTRTDSLTGLQTVRYLSETMTRVLRGAQRRGEAVSFVYMDVDHFKTINDTYGHLHGDEILQAVGSSIKKVSRADDSCFRYGGDEFCIVLPDCEEHQAREIYLDRLREEIAKRFPEVTISVGIVQTGPHDFLEPEALIRRADEGMYLAKKAASKGN